MYSKFDSNISYKEIPEIFIQKKLDKTRGQADISDWEWYTIHKEMEFRDEAENNNKKLKQRIKEIEEEMALDYYSWGYYRETAVKRYILGPSYLMLGDLTGALKSFAWFEEKFREDSGEPLQYLCWTLALYKAKRYKEAKRKLIETMLLNVTMVEYLLDIDQEEKRGGAWNAEWECDPWLSYIDDQYFSLWDEEALKWLKSIFYRPRIRNMFREYGKIQNDLQFSECNEHQTEKSIKTMYNHLNKKSDEADQIYFCDVYPTISGPRSDEVF